MSLRPHSDAWYERLASMQAGYFYPWSSTIAPGNGEDAYLDLVRRHLSPNLDVLDAGCGDGELTFGLAPLCRTIHGYDRVQRFIDIAVAASRERGVDNARFIHFDSHSNANDGHVYVPVPDTSIDVVVSRRGPTHWIEDVRRFCRPGATLIQLNPLDRLCDPAWNRDVPAAMRLPPPEPDPDTGMRGAIEQRLALVGLRLHSAWTLDVPEWLDQPRDLYKFLTFGEDTDEVPPWPEISGDLQRAFERHAGPHGLELRHRGFLWKAIVE